MWFNIIENPENWKPKKHQAEQKRRLRRSPPAPGGGPRAPKKYNFLNGLEIGMHIKWASSRAGLANSEKEGSDEEKPVSPAAEQNNAA